jgi:tripartite-type tricarboxylate transporter receptor subunit TctC
VSALFATTVSLHRFESLQTKAFAALPTPQEQGVQIGRIFAHWVIIYFGHYFETYRKSPQ